MIGARTLGVRTLEVCGGHIVLLPKRTVLNPTEVLDGLLEDISMREPIKEELREAAAARIRKKLGGAR